MYLVVTEGPAAEVPGLNLAQLAAFMRSLSVRDADLDDDGSTTIVARLGKHIGLTLLNRSSDGSQRPVADGLGLVAMNAARA